MNLHYNESNTNNNEKICKDHELLKGSITKAQHIFIKGVGNRIKVCSHSTIKTRVVDNINEACDLTIINVLYVPESLTTLLSPKLWSELVQNPACIGEITIGGITLSFWINNTHTKTITHHPHLKLPVFYTNRGRAMSNFIKRAGKCNHRYQGDNLARRLATK